MFRIEAFPAGHGDCLLLEYGDQGAPHRILIDGGTTGTAARLKRRFADVPHADRDLELLVVTHVDGDHIAGILKLLEDEPSPLRSDDIWFNGWRHLPQGQLEPLGPVQGERLTDYLVRPSTQWNVGFSREAVMIRENAPLPRVTLPGGMKLTVLSPGQEELATLRPVWECEARKAGLDPCALRPEEEDPDTRPSGLEVLGATELPDVEALADAPFEEDPSKANGTSIVLLAEFAGHSVLLTGDAHADVVAASIDRLLAERGKSRLKLDLLKLPHHGSKANTSRDLLSRVDCADYLVSTNGSYHQHPDAEAISRVIVHGGSAPRLHFNYLSKHNKVWQTRRLMDRHGYEAVYPSGEGKPLLFDLEDMA